MAVWWDNLHCLKPPKDLELLMWIWATLKFLNLIWNPSPYVICSIIIHYFYGKHHCSYSITQCSGWYLNFNMYVCIYKTNGVTSTCTQNKSHTTHLQILSLTSVCKNIYNQYNKTIFIVHYICPGDAGRFWWAHQGHDLSLKCNSTPNGSGPCFSDTRVWWTQGDKPPSWHTSNSEILTQGIQVNPGHIHLR